jgi:ABC-type microcin C transport system permease subunit YejB
MGVTKKLAVQLSLPFWLTFLVVVVVSSPLGLIPELAHAE